MGKNVALLFPEKCSGRTYVNFLQLQITFKLYDFDKRDIQKFPISSCERSSSTRACARSLPQSRPRSEVRLSVLPVSVLIVLPKLLAKLVEHTHRGTQKAYNRNNMELNLAAGGTAKS